MIHPYMESFPALSRVHLAGMLKASSNLHKTDISKELLNVKIKKYYVGRMIVVTPTCEGVYFVHTINSPVRSLTDNKG
jgi:hypothetical protein